MNKTILYILIIILILGAMGGIWYFFLRTTTSNPSGSLSPSIANSGDTEVWLKNPKVLFENTTSTDTHKLDDGTFRMYLMGPGGILYADSSDATTFSKPLVTGITEDPGKMISNPAVIKIADSNWIMIYEEAPIKQPGQKEGPPSKENQRNLMLATSTDGKNFTKAGIAIDSALDDNFFASVPSLIKTPDGKIRMYYVCGGDKTCSAASLDGKTWVKEAGERVGEMGVDPDVLYRENKWVMYYTQLTGANNKFLKSTSSDGLKWSKGVAFLEPSNPKGAIVDPDVVEIAPNKYRMFFGEMTEGDGISGPAQINLYYADFNGDIFS